jgi:hypothetical protein
MHYAVGCSLGVVLLGKQLKRGNKEDPTKQAKGAYAPIVRVRPTLGFLEKEKRDRETD